MWIERVDLDDFGCFTRARLEGLDDGLTVIAGPQRAGKSTFMHALRQLGYGVDEGAALPPPADRYGVVATVVAGGHRYEIELDGYAEPDVTALDEGAPEQTARQLFGGLPRAQYEQLYTVSLSELRRSPHSLDDDVKLSTVLLEGAYGQAMELPDLKADLASTAESIGGKHGRASYRLGDAVDRIEDGIEQREAALEQVETYEARASDLEAVEERLAENADERERLGDEETRLEAVTYLAEDDETLGETQERLASLDATEADVAAFPTEHVDRVRRLAQEYDDQREVLREQQGDFEAAVSVEKPEGYRSRLLDRAEELAGFERERSGWEAKLETIEAERSDLEEQRQRLERRVAGVHESWDEDLDRVRGLDLDLFDAATIREARDTYETATDEIGRIETEIEDLEARAAELSAAVEEAQEGAAGGASESFVPRLAGSGLIAATVGGATALALDPLAGVVVAVGLVLLAVGYFLRTAAGTVTVDGIDVDTVEASRREVESDLAGARKRLSTWEDRRDEASTELREVASAHGLPGDDPAAIGECYEELTEVSAAVQAFDDDREALEATEAEVRTELHEVADTLAAVGVIDEAPDDPIERADDLLAAVDRAADHLSQARSVATAQSKAERTADELRDLLAAWDELDAQPTEPAALRGVVEEFLERAEDVTAIEATREERDRAQSRIRSHLSNASVTAAFQPVLDGEAKEEDDGPDEVDGASLQRAFETVREGYATDEDVAERLAEIDERLTELEGEADDLRDEKSDLEAEMERLASHEDVREAHETIQAGRQTLEPRLESYATHRLAEHLLEQLHERFVERTTGPLLDEAADIFERITGGEYDGLESRNEFEALDFAASLREGELQQSDELSRATAEQLFLAIRLARIQRNDEPLPVLLDDSLTNFDPGHVQRTLDVIAELADETQVFLLTCHPTLVEAVASRYEASYCVLEDGRFDGPTATDDAIAVFED